MPTEGLSEDDLFDGAVSEAPADEAAAEPASEAAEQPGQARDEAGRFAGKPENESETVAATDPTAKTPVDDNAPQVPSWRVREINEEKRAALAELETLRAERAQWQQRQQPQPEVKQADKPAKPDPLLDPDGYADWVENRAQERYLSERREDSLQRAREANTKDFDEAYTAARQAVDPALKARMNASRDPGKTLLEWHRENKQRAEIGNDLAAYKQRIRDEALKDPEYRKAAIAAWQADANPQSNGRPRVELPPSLNGASRSNAALQSSMANLGDDELFDATTA